MLHEQYRVFCPKAFWAKDPGKKRPSGKKIYRIKDPREKRPSRKKIHRTKDFWAKDSQEKGPAGTKDLKEKDLQEQKICRDKRPTGQRPAGRKTKDLLYLLSNKI